MFNYMHILNSTSTAIYDYKFRYILLSISFKVEVQGYVQKVFSNNQIENCKTTSKFISSGYF